MIRNIWAVARNYSLHAKELGNEIPKQPLFFLKAGSSASIGALEFELPQWTQDVHHEVELALQFGPDLGVSHIAIALDLTERQAQSTAKHQGTPWTLAKSFKNSCPLSPLIPAPPTKNLQNLDLNLWVNDHPRQSGNTQQMIFNIPTLMAFALEHFPVCPGDLLLTGTPPGVGPLMRGDKIRAEIPGVLSHIWQVR